MTKQVHKPSSILHSAIPDGRTWSKLGEHEEHKERGEQGKDGKHQPDKKISSYVSKHSVSDSKHSCWQSYDSKHFILRFLCQQSKKS